MQLANMDQKFVDPRFFTSYIHRDATVIDMHCDTISRYMSGEDLKKDQADIRKILGENFMRVFTAVTQSTRSK